MIAAVPVEADVSSLVGAKYEKLPG